MPATLHQPLTLPSVEQFVTLAYVQLAPAHGTRSREHLRTVSGHCQKAMLLAIAARRGRITTLAQLSDMASCSREAGIRAVTALVESGIVRYREPVPPSKRACAYEVVWERVFDLLPERTRKAVAA